MCLIARIRALITSLVLASYSPLALAHCPGATGHTGHLALSLFIGRRTRVAASEQFDVANRVCVRTALAIVRMPGAHFENRWTREDHAMNARHAVHACSAILSIALVPAASFGQADPFWMRSWNEAQRTRPATMGSTSRIAPASEPGTPLVIHGVVMEPDGRTPAPGVIVQAYHRDRDGFDFGPNDSALTTWRLQGWAKTGADGRFEFRTIRPAPDHLGREGSHVHFTLETPRFGRQWAHKILFADDPLVPEIERRRSAEAEDFAWVRQVSVVQGVQHVDVKLRIKTTKDF
jgi:hypothetical protein